MKPSEDGVNPWFAHMRLGLKAVISQKGDIEAMGAPPNCHKLQ